MEQYGHDQLIKDITEIKTKQAQHRKDIDQLMEDNRVMLAMNQNVETLAKTMEKLTNQVGSAIERIETLENRPAQAMYTKAQEIRDKVIIGVCTSGIIAIIVAIVELIK
jgi:DNA-directed RNA polymerase specialized sigma54-like protein